MSHVTLTAKDLKTFSVVAEFYSVWLRYSRQVLEMVFDIMIIDQRNFYGNDSQALVSIRINWVSVLVKSMDSRAPPLRVMIP